MASRNIVIKKQYTLLWISFALTVFRLLVFGCLYRDQSPILERRAPRGGRLYTGNFNPISSSFIQKCSQKYSLCWLRELTKRNFDLRRGILQVKRSLELSFILIARSISTPYHPQAPVSADSLGPGKQEKGPKAGADRLQKWSLLPESSNRLLSRFSGERRQARSQRGAPDTHDGRRSSLPQSRVSCACHSRVASHADVSYGSITRSCGAGKRDQPPRTSPWEANSRVTSDDRCSTNERVCWEGFDCITWPNLRFNFRHCSEQHASTCLKMYVAVIHPWSASSWNTFCSVMQEVLKVLL